MRPGRNLYRRGFRVPASGGGPNAPPRLPIARYSFPGCKLPHFPGMQPTLLIVDDEKHTRDGLRASMEDSFDVYVAANVQEALNVLEAESVDLVLTDLRLGGEDGMRLIEQILARPKPPLVIM